MRRGADASRRIHFRRPVAVRYRSHDRSGRLRRGRWISMCRSSSVRLARMNARRLRAGFALFFRVHARVLFPSRERVRVQACRRVRVRVSYLSPTRFVTGVRDGRSSVCSCSRPASEGRPGCAVLRNRACAAPEISGSPEVLRQSPYTCADASFAPAACTAAFRAVRLRPHATRRKHLVSCVFSNRADVLHALHDASTPWRRRAFARSAAPARR